MNPNVCTTKLLEAIEGVFPHFPDHLLQQLLIYFNSSSADFTSSAYLKLDKPYGCNYVLCIADNFGLSLAQLKCGQSSSEHYHETRREFFIVKKGELTLFKNGENHVLSCGQWGFSTPFIPHSINNCSASEDLEILEIFSPPLLDDKIRLKDRYARKVGKVGHKE